MADDTPTQRFPASDSGDLPTQRIDTAPVGELADERQKSRGLLIGLIAAGALLIIAVVVLLVLLLGRDSGAPVSAPTDTPVPSETAVPSDTPTASPEPTPSATEDPPSPPPPSTALTIDSFTVSPSTVSCNTSAPVPPPDPTLSFTWRTSNAVHVYFAVGKVTDAQTQGQGWDDLPEDGNENDFPDNASFTFYCPTESQSYTITAADGQGNRQTRTVKVVNNGDTQ